MNVTLTLQILKEASVVPSQTVQMGGKGTYLFEVRPDDTVEQRLVTQGVRYEGLVVVSQGNDLPAVDYPVIQVSVTYPGASPETIANSNGSIDTGFAVFFG